MSSIITERTMRKYKRVFNFLWGIKRVEQAPAPRTAPPPPPPRRVRAGAPVRGCTPRHTPAQQARRPVEGERPCLHTCISRGRAKAPVRTRPHPHTSMPALWCDCARARLASPSWALRESQTQRWQWWKYLFSLKLFLRPRVNEIGLFTGTSTRKSEIGWSLQPLKYVYSNSKMVAATRDANELRMLVWAVRTARVRPESPSRRVAE